MLIAQLDGTVVVAALPTIAADLHSEGAVAAVYLLTVTVTTPVHGKLGDLLGRRIVFHGALLAFAAGSAACALAPSAPALIAARALQGVGGGGLVVTAISALAQMFTREELIRRQGYLIGVLALSSLAGSLGTAAFGWLLLTVPASRTGVTLVMAVAALCLLAALLTAPRHQDDAALSP